MKKFDPNSLQFPPVANFPSLSMPTDLVTREPANSLHPDRQIILSSERNVAGNYFALPPRSVVNLEEKKLQEIKKYWDEKSKDVSGIFYGFKNK